MATAVGIDIVVNWNDVIRQTGLRRFRAHKGGSTPSEPSLDADLISLDMSPHVGMLASFLHASPSNYCWGSATLRLFPGITSATIRAFLMPPTRGVVLETFGAGNAPQRADLMSLLKEACDRGVVIVAISQCAKGSVSDAYETGRTLLRAGVVPGADMTPEVSQTIAS